MISSKVGTQKRSSKAQFAGRKAGRRSRARSVLISASVKSSVNQPDIVLAVDDLGAAPPGELGMLRNVRRAPDLVLMTGDEYAVAGHDQVGLDIVRALLDRSLVTLEGMFRPLPARPSMGNHDYARRVRHCCTPR